MTYQLVAELAGDFPIERLCNTLGIRRSAYYAYQSGQSYQLTEGKEKLRQAMLTSFTDHRRRYGSRRLLTELQEQGFEVGRHQLRRLMQAEGLRAIQPRSFIPRTTDIRIAGTMGPLAPTCYWKWSLLQHRVKS
ncbi:IS3 family transposase [Spirosoma litoris]